MDVSHDAQRILDLGDLVTPICLRTAARLRIADRLRDTPRSVDDMASATESNPQVMRRVLDHLVALEILSADDDGRYRLAPRGEPLLSEFSGGTVRALLDPTHLMGRMDMAVMGLGAKLSEQSSPYEAVHGRDVWADMDEIGPDLDGFGAVRSSYSPAQYDAELIVRGYDWSKVGSVIDVGGGTGAILEWIAREHSHITGTVLDLDWSVEAIGTRMERAGLADRVSAVSGDFFEPLPPGFDVYLLSTVLNDWHDTDAVRILRRCAEAAGVTGRVLISDAHLIGSSAHHDVRMTRSAIKLETSIPQPDRSVAAIKELLHTAGLEVIWEGQHTAIRSLIEARPEEK